jgi:hypothetical protein
MIPASLGVGPAALGATAAVLADDHLVELKPVLLILLKFRDCVIDEQCLLTKPKWPEYLN